MSHDTAVKTNTKQVLGETEHKTRLYHVLPGSKLILDLTVSRVIRVKTVCIICYWSQNKNTSHHTNLRAGSEQTSNMYISALGVIEDKINTKHGHVTCSWS